MSCKPHVACLWDFMSVDSLCTYETKFEFLPLMFHVNLILHPARRTSKGGGHSSFLTVGIKSRGCFKLTGSLSPSIAAAERSLGNLTYSQQKVRFLITSVSWNLYEVWVKSNSGENPFSKWKWAGETICGTSSLGLVTLGKSGRVLLGYWSISSQDLCFPVSFMSFVIGEVKAVAKGHLGSQSHQTGGDGFGT